MRLRLQIFFSEPPPAWLDYEEYTNSAARLTNTSVWRYAVVSRALLPEKAESSRRRASELQSGEELTGLIWIGKRTLQLGCETPRKPVTQRWRRL
jgi:hypothetical protein